MIRLWASGLVSWGGLCASGSCSIPALWRADSEEACVFGGVCWTQDYRLHGLGIDVRMYKRRDYVELYEQDPAKWALLRNVNTVVKHTTLLPVWCVCVCVLVYATLSGPNVPTRIIKPDIVGTGLRSPWGKWCLSESVTM